MTEDIDRLKPLGNKDAKWTKFWSNSSSRVQNVAIDTVYPEGDKIEGNSYVAEERVGHFW